MYTLYFIVVMLAPAAMLIVGPKVENISSPPTGLRDWPTVQS